MIVPPGAPPLYALVASALPGADPIWPTLTVNVLVPSEATLIVERTWAPRPFENGSVKAGRSHRPGRRRGRTSRSWHRREPSTDMAHSICTNVQTTSRAAARRAWRIRKTPAAQRPWQARPRRQVRLNASPSVTRYPRFQHPCSLRAPTLRRKARPVNGPAAHRLCASSPPHTSRTPHRSGLLSSTAAAMLEG